MPPGRSYSVVGTCRELLLELYTQQRSISECSAQAILSAAVKSRRSLSGRAAA